MEETLAFACDLIRRTSVTPNDAGCQELLAARLATAGFTVEVHQFGEVTNLWARRGTMAPVLCFAGHTDVVPAGPREEWQSDPFVPEVRSGTLYGRGAADMKAGLAAMVDAASGFVAARPDHRGSIAFLITSDEEGKAQDGTKRMMQVLEERGERLDWCVIGEPSSETRLGDTVRIGRRGSLSGILTVHGLAGHVAYPHLARNPIQAFAPALTALYSTSLDNGNESFPPSSFQMVKLESNGDAVNVTPGSLSARFNIRYSTVWTHPQLRSHVEQILQDHKLDYTLVWHLSGEPFLTPPGELIDTVAAAVTKLTGVVPALSTGGGTSDGRFIAPSGTHVVEFGAVNATIHKPNEEIPVADIAVMRSVYREILDRLLG
ncbi:MAG: succinyl-diaminopimelate desuccinylase [Gammaproteobacteria bacterium]|nr:succinyl-diaminopimelate desuccinylase [Gammaproteobacteria bacterium]